MLADLQLVGDFYINYGYTKAGLLSKVFLYSCVLAHKEKKEKVVLKNSLAVWNVVPVAAYVMRSISPYIQGRQLKLPNQLRWLSELRSDKQECKHPFCFKCFVFSSYNILPKKLI